MCCAAPRFLLNQGFSGDVLEEYEGWSALLAMNAAVRCCGVAEKQTQAFDRHTECVAADAASSLDLPRRFASSRHRRRDVRINCVDVCVVRIGPHRAMATGKSSCALPARTKPVVRKRRSVRRARAHSSR